MRKTTMPAASASAAENPLIAALSKPGNVESSSSGFMTTREIVTLIAQQGNPRSDKWVRAHLHELEEKNLLESSLINRRVLGGRFQPVPCYRLRSSGSAI